MGASDPLALRKRDIMKKLNVSLRQHLFNDACIALTDGSTARASNYLPFTLMQCMRILTATEEQLKCLSCLLRLKSSSTAWRSPHTSDVCVCEFTIWQRYQILECLWELLSARANTLVAVTEGIAESINGTSFQPSKTAVELAMTYRCA